ncbi:hypothetical protein AVEN_33894-1 [Araneus ventricosus]|uniref:Uncharacterized protein n=1 Tax=Araneus ventricosus TaxID=182803 RepID=A0A4Y2EJX9_ARAVE|nr:hypothetical protein AVEN_33894-1 [Araneus ventricosus]
MQVLWLGRELYKVKHGVTSATVMAPLTLVTILAIWRPWRQIDDSRKCNPFLDISTSDAAAEMKIEVETSSTSFEINYVPDKNEEAYLVTPEESNDLVKDLNL